jgi:hypothetical protein
MRQSFPNEDEMVGAEIVMHDTLNDKYYTFKFNQWSVGDNGGDGGFGYVRRLINHTQYFTKTNYGNELDSIDTGLVITRGNNGGIYNDDAEGSWDSDVSPQGTEWNIDGWNDLSNLLTRTYTNFASAFSYQLGERIIGTEAIMHDTINDKYYAVKFTQWTTNNNGGGFTWQRRLIDTTQLDEGLHFADGTVQTTAGITFNSNGSLDLPGGLVLPYQINKGYNVFTTLDAPTLQLSNDSNNQVVITGPAATADNSYAQRIVIQGQRGYGSTSTTGEGGDVYIWGGIGGEFNGNTEGWGRGGGSGGDVKLRGGEGLNDTGGYVRIEGGNVAHFNTSTTGNAGFVEITGGDVIIENAAGSSYGGDIRITGGRAYTATTQSGVVQVITGGYTSGDVVGDKIWEFGNDGTLSFPNNQLRVPDGNSLEIKSTHGVVYSRVEVGDTYAIMGLQDNDTGTNSAWSYFENDMANVNTPSATVIIKPGDTGDEVRWTFNNDGSLSLPARTASTSTSTTTGGVIKIKGSVRTLPGDIPTYGIPGVMSEQAAVSDKVIWTADSVLVTAAKITLRVAYYNTQATGWDNTEIIELLITKTNPGQGSASTDANIAVIGRVKSNAGYTDSTVDWDYDVDNRLVLLSTPDATNAADCNIYWNYDVVAFEHTID